MIEVRFENSVLSVMLRGEIDHHHADILRTEIDMEIRKHMPAGLVLDFSGVNFCDSSGIAIVLGRYKLMHKLGGNVVLCGLTGQIDTIFKMANIEKLVTVRR